MTFNNTGFINIITGKHPDATMSGHGTSVRRRGTSNDMDIVEKTVNPKGCFKNNPEQWFENNKNARIISREIRALDNPAYFVPTTFISHREVYEQFVDGTKLRNVGEKYLENHQHELICAIGNFINDMTELRPVKIKKSNNSVPGVRLKDVNELNGLLDNFSSVLSKSVQKTIKDVYVYLRDLPENNEFVFAHKDLHPNNIIINTKTNLISIIDFEMSGYQSKFAAMYQMGTTSFPELWDYINHLPRTKNPNLQWDFDNKKQELFRFLRWTTAEMKSIMLKRENFDIYEFVQKFEMNCKVIRLTLENNKNGTHTKNKHLQIMTPVLLKHYEK